MRTAWEKEQNINTYRYIDKTAAVVIFLAFTLLLARVNAAYFSYILIVVSTFFLGEAFCYKGIFPNAGRLNLYFVLSFASLYSGFLCAQLINNDYTGIIIVLKWASYSVSMWLVWYICGSYFYKTPIKYGIYLGTFISSLAAIVECVHYPAALFNAKGLYGHHNTLGAMMMLAIPVLLSFTFSENNKLGKVCGIFFVNLAIIGLIFSGSRGAIISLALALIVGFFIHMYIYWNTVRVDFKNAIKLTVIISFIIAICISGAYRVQMTRTDEASLGGERILMVNSSLEMWNDYKLAGIGVSRWKDNYNGIYKQEGSHETGLNYDHNIITFSLATAGVIGAIGLIASFAAMIVGFYKVYIISNNKIMIEGLFISFLAFFIHCQVNPDLQNNTIPRLYFALIGLAMADYSNSLTSQYRRWKKT